MPFAIISKARSRIPSPLGALLNKSEMLCEALGVTEPRPVGSHMNLINDGVEQCNIYSVRRQSNIIK
jgi:hypothetical protein